MTQINISVELLAIIAPIAFFCLWGIWYFATKGLANLMYNDNKNKSRNYIRPGKGKPTIEAATSIFPTTGSFKELPGAIPSTTGESRRVDTGSEGSKRSPATVGKPTRRRNPFRRK